jgi:hypothetical protein
MPDTEINPVPSRRNLNRTIIRLLRQCRELDVRIAQYRHGDQDARYRSLVAERALLEGHVRNLRAERSHVRQEQRRRHQ